MSEYTTIYLRCKEIPLLKYKEHPSYEEYQKLSKEDLMKVNREIDEYNKQVTKSLGCKLANDGLETAVTNYNHLE